MTFVGPWPLTSRSNNWFFLLVFSCPGHNIFVFRDRSMIFGMWVHDGHAPTYQISLTYLERQKCYGPDKKILIKKQLFDLEVKGQGPTKVIMVCDTALWSCTHIPIKYYLKNNYLTSRSKVKVPRRSLQYVTHRLMVILSTLVNYIWYVGAWP
jgi:hypothetical protein